MAKKQPRRPTRAARMRAGREAITARTRTRRASSGVLPVVTIRFRSAGEILDRNVKRDGRIVRLAEQWAYRLRSRARWADDEDLRRSLRDRALEDLESLGVPRTFMKRMASCRHAEVELCQWDATDTATNVIHEAAADMPWEYLLSAATRGVGRYRSLLVTRLFRSDKAPKDIPQPPSTCPLHRERAGPRRGRVRLRVGAQPDSRGGRCGSSTGRRSACPHHGDLSDRESPAAEAARAVGTVGRAARDRRRHAPGRLGRSTASTTTGRASAPRGAGSPPTTAFPTA